MDTQEDNKKETAGEVDQVMDREEQTPTVADPLSPNEQGVGATDGAQNDGNDVQGTTGGRAMMTCPVDPDLIPSDGASLQGTFVKDLLPMMIGFGDDETPLLETAHVMEGYVIDYAQGILQAALELNAKRGRVKASNGKPLGVPSAEDIMTVVRHDGRKVQRVEELLIMQKEIKIIQEMEKTDEESLAKLLVEN